VYNVPSISSSRVDSENGSGVLASYKKIAPDIDLERGWKLREWILTSLHHHLISWSDWKKPSSSLLDGCKAELGRGPR